jgi:hypothetical protein
MRNKFPELSEGLIGIAIVIALVLLINPFNFLMTSAVTLTLIMILAVAVIAFAIFIWREKPLDEREALHSLMAGRISYFIGGGVLVVAIIAQSVRHHLDLWLAVTLGAMVLTKLFVSAWMRRK